MRGLFLLFHALLLSLLIAPPLQAASAPERKVDTNIEMYGTSLFLGIDGTVGAPGISFQTDPDSGLYRIGANNLGIGVGGAKVLDISTTGLGITGTLTAPSGGTFGGTFAGAVTWSGLQTLGAGAVFANGGGIPAARTIVAPSASALLFNATGYLDTNGLALDYATNGTATTYLNFVGYQAGVTQFRNTVIGDGKAGTMVTFSGSTGSTNFVKPVTIDVSSGLGLSVEGSGTTTATSCQQWKAAGGTVVGVIDCEGGLQLGAGATIASLTPTTITLSKPVTMGHSGATNAPNTVRGGTYSQLNFVENSGSYYNWAIATRLTVEGALEFVPSTATGGTTFTAPVMILNQSGAAVNGPSAGYSNLIHTTNGNLQLKGNYSPGGAAIGVLDVYRESSTASDYIAEFNSNVGGTKVTVANITADGGMDLAASAIIRGYAYIGASPGSGNQQNPGIRIVKLTGSVAAIGTGSETSVAHGQSQFKIIGISGYFYDDSAGYQLPISQGRIISGAGTCASIAEITNANILLRNCSTTVAWTTADDYEISLIVEN